MYCRKPTAGEGDVTSPDSTRARSLADRTGSLVRTDRRPRDSWYAEQDEGTQNPCQRSAPRQRVPHASTLTCPHAVTAGQLRSHHQLAQFTIPYLAVDLVHHDPAVDSVRDRDCGRHNIQNVT